MKKSYLMLLLVTMFALVACNHNDSEVVVDTTQTNENAIIDGKVSLTRAISNADFVFRNTEELGNKTRKIKSVDVLKRANANSRVTRTSSLDEQDALAYVVNYDNNEGFAILAATTKLPPVISIGDEGNFNTEGFVNFIQNNGATRSGEEINPAQEVQYAIINNSLILPPINVGEQELLGVDTTVMFKCLPLTPTKWGQESPYNYYAYDPNNQKAKAGCVPIAGAQVLASLCYHHNWRPTTQLSSTYHIDWYAINRMMFYDIFKFASNDYSDNALTVASLVRAVGEDVNASYGVNQTGAPTENLANTYLKLGMSSAEYYPDNYNTPFMKQEVFNMIVNLNYPVNARARSNSSNGYVGHSFIFDGWLRLEYSLLGYSTIENIPGVLERIDDNFQRSLDLVHINFGWYGYSDGYYLPDAINLTTDKYREYAEDNDKELKMEYVFELNPAYIIYNL